MTKYILLISSLSQILFAQISQGGTPKYVQNQDLLYLEPSTDLVIERNFNTNKLWGRGFTLNNSLKEYDIIDRNNIKEN